MFSKPFKPLTIRKPLQAYEHGDSETQAPKRRKLSASADQSPSLQGKPPSSTLLSAKTHDTDTRPPLKHINNVTSQVEPVAGKVIDGCESYYSILWRVQTNKKNKTWTDDGVLLVSGGYATLYNNAGRSIGRTAFSTPLLTGSNLKIGGKEVEVDSCISKKEYLAVTKPGALSTNVESSSVAHTPSAQRSLKVQKPMASIQAQMRAQMEKERLLPPKQHSSKHSRVGAFKQPLKESTLLKQGPGESPKPRHDPEAAGAVVFKRPLRPPPGRQLVDVVLDPLLGRQLRPHQKEGVQFLYECVMGLRDFNGQGCILADDMGLGKTLTTIALLWTLLRQNPVFKDPPVVKKALIVCPVSLIRNWKREFKKWLGSDRLGVLEFEDQNTRLNNFDGRVYQVMIIGYERLRMVADDLAKGQPIDVVICDEGHRLKTMKNKNAKAIESLNTRRRIILSGTPIQNDLGEFFAMVNFVNDGCLGSLKGFIRDFEKPILRSRQPEVSEEELELGQAASAELAQTTSPFILRRTAEILANFLPPQTEYVLFCKPTPAQTRIYLNVLKSPMFHSALRSNETAFQLITILKKLCNSPALMNPRLGNDDASPSSSLTTLNDMLPEGLSKLYQNSMSCKIRLLDQLLQQIRYKTDEKVVVISNYTSTLNLIEQLVVNSNLSYLRLDGSVPAKKRTGLVDQFNRSNPSQSFVFLLSAKAGGLGLNLIGASRLILFDIDWNPATDDQAVARIHRQGQKRHCKIYRFLIKGSLEERIWQRQVVKRALADSIMQGGANALTGSLDVGGKGKASTTSFSQEELKDLFRLDESDGLRTHDLIGCECKGAGVEDGDLGESLANEGESGEEESLQSLMDGSEDELPDVAAVISKEGLDRTQSASGRKKRVPKAVPKTDLEAERQELLQYMHLDTSILSKNNGDDDLTKKILVAVDDQCLEHVLGLGEDMTGGSGVSYIFKKTKGSQVIG